MSQRSASNPRNLKNAKTGASKRSAARAKPKRDAAGTVRVSTGSAKAGGRALTAEERKVAEREKRMAANRDMAAVNVLLKKEPGYKRNRTIWGVMLVSGLAMTILSWVVMLVLPGQGGEPSALASRLAIVALVLAYVLVIGSFIFDFTKIRSLRKAMETKVASMSDKRIDDILREEAFARAAKKNARKGLLGGSAAKAEEAEEAPAEEEPEAEKKPAKTSKPKKAKKETKSKKADKKDDSAADDGDSEAK